MSQPDVTANQAQLTQATDEPHYLHIGARENVSSFLLIQAVDLRETSSKF